MAAHSAFAADAIASGRAWLYVARLTPSEWP